MPPAIAPGPSITIEREDDAAEQNQPLAHRIEPAGPLGAGGHPGGKQHGRGVVDRQLRGDERRGEQRRRRPTTTAAWPSGSLGNAAAENTVAQTSANQAHSVNVDGRPQHLPPDHGRRFHRPRLQDIEMPQVAAQVAPHVLRAKQGTKPCEDQRHHRERRGRTPRPGRRHPRGGADHGRTSRESTKRQHREQVGAAQRLHRVLPEKQRFRPPGQAQRPPDTSRAQQRCLTSGRSAVGRGTVSGVCWNDFVASQHPFDVHGEDRRGRRPAATRTPRASPQTTAARPPRTAITPPRPARGRSPVRRSRRHPRACRPASTGDTRRIETTTTATALSSSASGAQATRRSAALDAPKLRARQRHAREVDARRDEAR